MMRRLVLAFICIVSVSSIGCFNKGSEDQSSKAPSAPDNQINPTDFGYLKINSGMDSVYEDEVSASEVLSKTSGSHHIIIRPSYSHNTTHHKKRKKHNHKPNLEYQEVWITVTEVSAYTEESGWVVLSSEIKELELISLASDATDILVNKQLPPGTYKMIRLKLAKDAYVVVNGLRQALKVPSGTHTGIKLITHFTIEKGWVTEFSLNFDPEKSIVAAGHGKNKKFILKPVIKVNNIEEDLQSPLIAIVAPAAPYSNAPVQFRVEYEDDNIDLASFSFLINGIEQKNNFNITSNFAEASILLTEGAYNLEASISDLPQNIAPPETKQIIVDTSAPVIILQSNSGSLANNPEISFSVGYVDALSGVKSDSLRIFVNDIDKTAQVTDLVVGSDGATGKVQLLNEGVNKLKVNISDNVNNVGSSEISITLDTVPPVLSNIEPAQGAVIYSPTNAITVLGVASENLASVTINNQSCLIFNEKSFSCNFSGTSGEVSQNAQLILSDLAGNSQAISHNFDLIIDQVAPVVSLTGNQNIQTKESAYSFNFQVTESSPFVLKIYQNGNLIKETSEASGAVNVILSNGANTFTASAADAAGNVSNIASLNNIILDQTPPVITISAPQSNSTLPSFEFAMSGSANERLSSVTAFGQTLNISSDGLGFSGQITAPIEGEVQIPVIAIDLAGNETSLVVPVTISTRLLNINLISVRISPKGNKLLIEGAQFSVRANAEVTLKTGIFSSLSTQADSLGRFSFEHDFFASLSIEAEDLATGETESGVLTFNIDTKLSGTVYAPDDTPLPGVLVTIEGTEKRETTDASGAFSFDNPVTGDQTLIIDGTTIPEAITTAEKKYPLRKITVNVAVGQNNVLMRPIYLAPLMLDGSETIITAGNGATVVSPHAPGVQLNIPAGSVTFPNGSNSGAISVMLSSSEKTIVPPLDFALPDQVIVLEPSGTQFSEPIQITVPNENNLPDGVEVAFMSMNSLSGLWEIDGIGKVSGGSITTKPGQGLTHFSEVYAVPIGPVLRSISEARNVGADAISGSASTQIDLPSYQALGTNFNTRLLYKSGWAKPTAYITNLFDIPEQEIDFETTVVDLREVRERVTVKSCFAKIICRTQYQDVYAFARSQTDIQIQAWYQPESMSFQFFVGGIASTSGTVTGEEEFTRTLGGETLTFTGIPSQTAISYAVELKNPDTNEFLPTDMYPTLSRYSVNLRALTLSSFKNVITGTDRPTQVTKDSSQSNALIEQAFQTDVVDEVLVQNQVNSSSGRGWKIANVQKIVNPDSNRIVIEEENGAASIYSINNTIDTVLDGNASNVDFSQGVSLSSYPNIAVTDKGSSLSPTQVLRFNVSTSNAFPSFAGVLLDYQGTFKTENPLCGSIIGGGKGDPGTPVTSTIVTEHPYRLKARTSKLIDLGSSIYGLSERDHNFFKVSSLNCVVKPAESQLAFLLNNFSAEPPDRLSTIAVLNLCQSLGINCPQSTATAVSCQQFGGIKPPAGNSIGTLGQPSTLFNSPKDMVTGPDGLIYVADTGNNIVKKFDPEILLTTLDPYSNQFTVAGNGSAADSGDGNAATSAGLFHPRALAFDSIGNLYIATEKGFIRKVDASGTITRFAGLPIEQGGILANEVHGSQLALNRPSSLLMDNDNNYLYVSDTGNHRVLRIHLDTRIATVVAGTGVCDQVNPGQGAALNASLCSPTQIAFDNNKNLLIVDSGHNLLRRVVFNSAALGILSFAPRVEDQSTLIKNSDETWVRTYRNGTIVTFDQSGLHRTTEDRVGRITTYNYDSSNNLIRIIDPVGLETNLYYSSGKLSSITDPAGRTTSFQFSGEKLARVIFPDSTDRNFAYDQDGLLTAEIDQRGFSTQYLYNQYNRLEKIIRADNSEIIIADSVTSSIANPYTGTNSGLIKTIGTDNGQVYDGIINARQVETRFEKDLMAMLQLWLMAIIKQLKLSEAN